MIMKLKYIGEDDWGCPMYEEENGRLWKDTEHYSTKLSEGEKVDKTALCTVTNNKFDGEPCVSMTTVGKYNNIEIELVFDEVKTPSPRRYDYMLLSMLKSDCDYYLGNGNRHDKHLWAGNVKNQIEKMKELYNSFADEDKPEWLTYDEILHYEKDMN